MLSSRRRWVEGIKTGPVWNHTLYSPKRISMSPLQDRLLLGISGKVVQEAGTPVSSCEHSPACGPEEQTLPAERYAVSQGRQFPGDKPFSSFLRTSMWLVDLANPSETRRFLATWLLCLCHSAHLQAHKGLSALRQLCWFGRHLANLLS